MTVIKPKIAGYKPTVSETPKISRLLEKDSQKVQNTHKAFS